MHSETKYLHNGSLYTLDELHALGILLSSTTPTKTTVYGRVSGQTGTRFVGSGGDVIVKTSSGLLFYYATQAACDADWSTEEPYRIVYTNSAASLTTYVTGSSSFQPCYDSDGELARTSKTINLIAYYSDGAWKEPISSIVLHEYTYRAGATTYYYVFGWKVTDGSTIKVSAFKYTLS